MAGMKRFVTYIYSYENKIKGGNTGFAKFEIRGDDCRIEIHLRGLIGRTTCKVYLFKLDHGNMEGVGIGEIRIVNGAGDFGTVIGAGKIGASPFGIFDMEGIVLFSEDERMFLSRWTEGDTFVASKENFHVFKPAGTEGKHSHTEQVPKVLENAMQPDKTSENTEEPARPSESAADSRADAETEDSAHTDDAETPETIKVKEQPVPSDPMIAKTTGDPVENVTATEIPMQNFFPQYTWQEIWENMQNRYPVYEPFEDSGIQCIRIELKNLRELPKRYWYLGNNSFLLHGFFNYHYLIIGQGQGRCFLGIPGIFQRQEHVMATIFGFPEFLPTALRKGGEVRQDNEGKKTEPVNRFGFWLHYMDE